MAVAARSARAQPVKATYTQRSSCPQRSSSRSNTTNSIQRAYSKAVTQQAHMPVGSPTVGVIKPNHPEFPLFKHNLERHSERMQVFMKSHDSEDSVQLESLLKDSDKIPENLPLYIKLSSQHLIDMSQEIKKLKERVVYLENLTSKLN